MIDIEDELLKWRFKRGSREALARIYEKYVHLLLSVAMGLLNDPHEAEDTVQDVFVSFARNAAGFGIRGSLKAYLATCIINRARDRARSEHSRKRGADRYVPESSDAPYDFNKDEKLPKELRARIQSMINALKAKDGAAWVANYNLPYLYKLAKGQVAYDPNLFGGTAEDAQSFQKGLGNVASPEELAKRVASSLNSNGGEIYITSITMNKAGDHASAKCVSKNGDRTVVLGPQWHNFDGGWWQVDD